MRFIAPKWGNKNMKQYSELTTKNDRLYQIWLQMKGRCFNPRHKSFLSYGGRGITVCEEWAKNQIGYVKFKEWALNNGYDYNAKARVCTIDRINNNGNYEPSNCRWVTIKIQSNNRRNNHLETFNGETHTLSEWAIILNISRDVIKSRIERYGWTVEQAFTTPVRKKRRI